jgi:polar amino acid transport system substrate-binding protein
MVDFTDPYYTSQDGFIVADAFTGKITTPDDIVKYKVGVQTGTTQESYLKDTFVKTNKLAEANLLTYDRADQAAMDVKNGRIDIMMADYVAAKMLADKLGGLKVANQGVYSSGPMNVVVPLGDKALGGEINTIIKQLQSEGFIDKLAVKYFGVN